MQADAAPVVVHTMHVLQSACCRSAWGRAGSLVVAEGYYQSGHYQYHGFVILISSGLQSLLGKGIPWG